jgi:hypothetical protein
MSFEDSSFIVERMLKTLCLKSRHPLGVYPLAQGQNMNELVVMHKTFEEFLRSAAECHASGEDDGRNVRRASATASSMPRSSSASKTKSLKMLMFKSLSNADGNSPLGSREQNLISKLQIQSASAGAHSTSTDSATSSDTREPAAAVVESLVVTPTKVKENVKDKETSGATGWTTRLASLISPLSASLLQSSVPAIESDDVDNMAALSSSSSPSTAPQVVQRVEAHRLLVPPCTDQICVACPNNRRFFFIGGANRHRQFSYCQTLALDSQNMTWFKLATYGTFPRSWAGHAVTMIHVKQPPNSSTTDAGAPSPYRRRGAAWNVLERYAPTPSFTTTLSFDCCLISRSCFHVPHFQFLAFKLTPTWDASRHIFSVCSFNPNATPS